jgi:hypothetical protein
MALEKAQFLLLALMDQWIADMLLQNCISEKDEQVILVSAEYTDHKCSSPGPCFSS